MTKKRSNDDLIAAVAAIGSALTAEGRTNMQAAFTAGRVIAKYYKKYQTNGTTYGEDFFGKLAAGLGVSVAMLRGRCALAEAYTPRQFEKLCAAPYVTLSKALQFAKIADEDTRKRIEALAIGERMSCTRLAVLIKETLTGRRASGAGRPALVPEDVDMAIDAVRLLAAQFSNKVESVWFGEEFSICEELERVPAGKLTADMRKKLRIAQKNCTLLQAAAKLAADSLGKAHDIALRRQPR